MKRSLKIIITLSLIILLTGCGFFESKEVNNDPNENIVKKTSEEKLGEFVDSYKESVEALSNDIFDARFIARGKSVVYAYTYKTVYNQTQIETMKPTLEKSIKDNSSVFTNLLSQLREIVPETEAVIVDYYNGDNSLITEIDFR